MPDRSLETVLELLRKHDTDYEARYPLVFEAARCALERGYEAGIRIDSKEPEWPCVYIELPTGQVSWHMPQHGEEYDGHTTLDKFRVIGRFIEGGYE
jgi:hypothetical protein